MRRSAVLNLPFSKRSLPCATFINTLLRVNMLSVVMLSVVMLSVVMLSVVMLSVIMLSVVAP